MEMTNITMTYKNTAESIYNANYAYALEKGKLSKKTRMKTAALTIAVEVIVIVITMLLEYFEKEGAGIYFVISLAVTLALTVPFLYFMKRSSLSQVKNVSRVQYEGGFDSKEPCRVTLKEEKMLLESSYSRFSVPYDEIDFVISDRMNFVLMIGSDQKIRCIPKINQNPDVLFAADNLLRDKLGERFIYKM